MEGNKVENVINIIKDMDIRSWPINKIKDFEWVPQNLVTDVIKDKLRLGTCLSTSDRANILYNKTEMYEKFDTILKEIDEEYRTTLINISKYKLVMFT